MARSQRDSLLFAGVLLVAVVLLGPLLMGGMMMLFVGGLSMGPGMMGVPGGLQLLVLLFVVLPPVLFALLVVWAWRRFTEGGEDRALAELRMALARGDITREEYERRRELLDEDARE